MRSRQKRTRCGSTSAVDDEAGRSSTGSRNSLIGSASPTLPRNCRSCLEQDKGWIMSRSIMRGSAGRVKMRSEPIVRLSHAVLLAAAPNLSAELGFEIRRDRLRLVDTGAPRNTIRATIPSYSPLLRFAAETQSSPPGVPSRPRKLPTCLTGAGSSREHEIATGVEDDCGRRQPSRLFRQRSTFNLRLQSGLS
jgi:hypothetical protein